MSENYDDKDLEKTIFKGGLASGAIEPSEKFWNKAYENILERDSIANKKRASRWRAGFFIMGAIAILLGAYAFYTHTEVTDIKQQLTTIETTQKNMIQQNTNQNSQSTSTEKTTVNHTVSDNQTISQTEPNRNIQQTTTEPAFATSNVSSANTFKKKSSLINTTTNTNYTGNISNTSQTQNANVVSNSLPNLSIGNTTSIANKPANSEAANNIVAAQPTNNTLPQSSAATTPDKPSQPTSLTPQVPKPTSTDVKTTSVATNANLDSTNALYLDRKPIRFKDILSNVSLSAFYAPGKTEDFLKDRDNDPSNGITAYQLKTRQDGDGTYATGFRLAYDISDRWSIFTGCYYSLYSYNINPTVIHAQQQENGEVGYSITTSSGTVFLPYSAGTTHVGDSIKVKGSSSRGYISIPLQGKYKFPVSSKLAFYLTGGFSVNIASYKETQINWQNTALQEGDLSVQSIYGLNTVQYSYNFGMGAEYLLGKGLSIYAEPYVDGSFTPINNNTPVITYPYFFGLALGVTYHF